MWLIFRMLHQMEGEMVDRKMLELLVCPVTKTALEYDVKKQELISNRAKLAYPIKDGVPIMVVEYARILDK